MTDINYYYSMLRSSIMWLEKYIEVAKYYSDWEQKKQTNDSFITRKDIYESKEKVLHPLGTTLMLSFEGMLDEEPLEFREELKREFYKWLDTSKINVENAPVELKCALFDFHEILECNFEKARKDRDSQKRELEIGSPEYMKKMQKVFQKSQEAIASGKVDEMDDRKFEGNAEAGKKTFDVIANSLTQEEKDNFHFWPQMSAEEKATKKEQQNNKSDNQTDPVLQSWRTSAISKIKSALKRAQLTNNDLEPDYQNWEIVINHSENIVEIASYSKVILLDIKKKKKKQFHTNPARKNSSNRADNRFSHDYFKFNDYPDSLLLKEE